jgi:hypothetical protein
MTSQSAFDYAKPYDIMVGYWVGTASICGPTGAYVMSTKSYVSVYWEKRYKKLSFRESGEEELESPSSLLDTRRAKHSEIADILRKNKKTALPASGSLRILTFDLEIDGPFCQGASSLVSLDGRQICTDAYQFHLKKKEQGINEGKPLYHHIYNSHHLPSPDDWRIIGPIVGPIDGVEGEVGLAVAQFFRRISYHVPKASVRELQ